MRDREHTPPNIFEANAKPINIEQYAQIQQPVAPKEMCKPVIFAQMINCLKATIISNNMR